MRTQLLVAVLATVSLIAGACKPARETMIGNSRVVTIDLECLDDDGVLGVSFTLSPWRVKIPEHGAIVWALRKAPQRQKMVIKPLNAARWPFEEPEFVTELGTPNRPGRLKEGLDTGTYKYTVTTICSRTSGAKDTVVIDPDMMIPPP